MDRRAPAPSAVANPVGRLVSRLAQPQPLASEPRNDRWAAFRGSPNDRVGVSLRVHHRPAGPIRPGWNCRSRPGCHCERSEAVSGDCAHVRSKLLRRPQLLAMTYFARGYFLVSQPVLADRSERAVKIGRTSHHVGIERNTELGGGGSRFLPIMLFRLDCRVPEHSQVPQLWHSLFERLSSFDIRSPCVCDMPVAFPPGWARRSTSPFPTGSP